MSEQIIAIIRSEQELAQNLEAKRICDSIIENGHDDRTVIAVIQTAIASTGDSSLKSFLTRLLNRVRSAQI